MFFSGKYYVNKCYRKYEKRSEFAVYNVNGQ